MALTGVHADYAGNRHRNGACGFSPLSVRGVTRCMCGGYPATSFDGDCTVCGAGYYDTMAEYEADIPPINSGRVVQEVFPITIIAHRGNKEVRVKGVREDSVSAKVDKEGNVTLSFEFAENADRIGYLPCIDWYETECEV